MKRISLAFMALVFLASCAGKYGVMKRRYNKGYYIAKTHNKKSSSELATSPKNSNHELLIAKVVTLNTPKQNSELKNLTAKQSSPSQENNSKPLSRQFKKNEVAPGIDNYHLSPLPKDIVNDQNTVLAPKSNKDEDVMLIVLVILAIIIPPLAVYLKNESFNKWFWITLILCLLTFSVFFFIFGGLAWLAAMVIALLYVLDAIE